jgi:hypothetical protein
MRSFSCIREIFSAAGEDSLDFHQTRPATPDEAIMASFAFPVLTASARW